MFSAQGMPFDGVANRAPMIYIRAGSWGERCRQLGLTDGRAVGEGNWREAATSTLDQERLSAFDLARGSLDDEPLRGEARGALTPEVQRAPG
jgi:hypothetical protein